LKDSTKLNEYADEHSLTAGEALKDIVLRRNEVAHGNPDPSQLLGANELISRIQIIRSLGEELQKFTISCIVELALQKHGDDCLIGIVSRHWHKHNAFELVSAKLPITLGERVLVIDNQLMSFDRISSIQIEGVSTGLYFGPPKTPLGLKMSSCPNKGAKIVRFSAISDFELLMDSSSESFAK
jgi:hypothetical protein